MVKNNVYVGQRYVPKIMGEWNQVETYEGLSIVTYQGTSYTSKKSVPVGIDIENQEFWVVTGNYNAQIENYRQEVKDTNNSLIEFEDETRSNFSKQSNDLIQRAKNVKQPPFNAVGDGVTDDTISINKALENGGEVFIPEGIYMINAHGDYSLKIKSNTHLVLHPKAVLKAIPNDYTSYSVISIKDVENVTITGGNIEGERLNHFGTSGEWGHCININSGKKITIKDVLIKNAWGDGIYVGGDNSPSENVSLTNIHVDNSRRNNISIVHCINLSADHIVVSNANGTAPQCGIDVEPNPENVVTNISLNNIFAYGNLSTGVYVAFDSTKVNLNTVYAYNNGSGIFLAGDMNRKGSSNSVTDSYAYNNNGLGFYVAYMSDTIIKDCQSFKNGDGGITVTHGVDNKILNSSFLRNTGDGITISYSSGMVIDGNSILYNTVNGFRSGGDSTNKNTNVAIKNNTFKGNVLTNLTFTHIKDVSVLNNSMRKNGENDTTTATNVINNVSSENVWFNGNDMRDSSSGVNVYDNGVKLINSGNLNKDGLYGDVF